MWERGYFAHNEKNTLSPTNCTILNRYKGVTVRFYGTKGLIKKTILFSDIEVSDIAEDDNDEVDSDDVITLPGGPDDEVDFDYILMKLGMHDVSNADALGIVKILLPIYNC